jgi:transposase
VGPRRRIQQLSRPSRRADRRAALPHRLKHYNTRRRHSLIGDRTPISRVHNLLGQDSLAILAELGDARRFSSSRKAVRYSGLDITVSESDARRAPGRLSRQGPATRRWAVFEAAQVARRQGSPDHDYYGESKQRLGANRACLAIARKLLQRSYHTLRGLGEEALRPA